MQDSQVLLFGDQLVKKSSAVQTLYGSAKSRPSLRAFLSEATDIVQCQLETLTPSEREAFGRFEDIQELVNHYESQPQLDEAVGAVVITIIQVGELLLLAETDPEVLASQSQVRQFGVCIGLLAGAVAATATNADQVIKLGLECVRISFNVGIELARRTRLVEESKHSWGCTVVGLHPDEIEKRLESFNRPLPAMRHAYVGVQANSWSTLFAPPSTITVLCDSEEFGQVPLSHLPSAMAVHAEHLPPLDVDAIVGDSPALEVETRADSIFSSSTCSAYDTSSFRELLLLVLQDIGQNTLLMESTIKNIAASLKGSDSVKLIPIGPTHAVPMVERELKRSVGAVKVQQVPQTEEATHGSRGGSNLVAIVGMSGRFPESDNLAELWDNLEAGKALYERIPSSRFTIEDFYDHSGEGETAVTTEYGCFLREPGNFDNQLFNISPREALQMDPLQRMFLMTTYEALEMAGYSRGGTKSTHPSRIASFMAQSVEDWKPINDQQGVDTHYIPGTMRSFAPGRLNHYFRWGGGYMSVDTACSASATAVHLASNALLSRECDFAVAGGGHLNVTPEFYSGLSKGGFLSKTGPCRTFEDTCDGYCRGEAVGIVVLKRLEDAIRENDNVLAVVRGSARNSNGGAASITFPSGEAQGSLYRQLLRETGVDPRDVSYVEMHGTATQAGDKTEMNAIHDVFGHNRPKDYPLHVGAIKANVGHAEGAAGISSMIKAILMLQKQKIPRQPGWPFELNHNFPDLDEANFRIADGKSPLEAWNGGDGKRKLLVNSFDAAGGNVSLLLQEASPSSEKEIDPRPHHVVVTSGRTTRSIEANELRLKEYLSEKPDTDLASLAYSSTARRQHELHRSAYVVQSIEELMEKLSQVEGKRQAPNRSPESNVKFAFTGQGSLYNGMGASLYEISPKFRATIESFQGLCDAQGLSRFIDIITGDEDITTATPSQTQLAIVSLEVALAQYWQALGLSPSLVIGHSLGEYAALCVAGVIAVSDMLYLVHTRATLIEERCTADAYAMLAVPLSAESTEEFLRESSYPSCQVACVNAPTMTVISGESAEVESIQTKLGERKLHTTLLKVPFGFHSSQLDLVLDSFEAVADQVQFAKPTVPVASTLLGEVVRSEGVFNATYLRRQMRERVDFLGAVRACENEGLFKSTATALEIGPHPVCMSLLAKSLQDSQPNTLASLRQNENDWKTISTSLAAAHVAGLPVNWQEFHKDFQQHLKLLELPSYAFDLKKYWVPYRTKRASDNSQQVLQPASDSTTTRLNYTCVQNLKSFVTENGKVKATFTSQTAEQNMFDAIQGHIVNDVALCPASVFADMAHTAAHHVLKSTGRGGEKLDLQISNLNMTHGLLVPEKNPDQVVSIEATLEEHSDVVSVQFTSSTGGAPSAHHGTCKVLFGQKNHAKLQEWRRMEKLIRTRVNGLVESSKHGDAHRMSKALFYKLFGDLVEYNDSYQSVKEAYLSPDFQDAAASVILGRDAGRGSFTCSPYTMDGLVHLSGFMLNADLAKDKNDVFISNRIGSYQVLGDLSTPRECICYATMREQTAKNVAVCDVYVFDQEGLLAFSTDITFQKTTKEIFAMATGRAVPAAAAAPPRERVPRAPRKVDHIDASSSDDSDTPSEGSRSSSVSRGTAATSVDAADTINYWGLLLKIISTRTGGAAEDFEPATSFADMGLDSQMGITILSDFQKQSGVNLPAAFFLSFPTVAEAEAELKGMEQSQQPKAAPPKPLPSQGVKESPKRSSDRNARVVSRKDPPSGKRPSETLLEIAAGEVGADPSEFIEYGDFASAGIDSMMSIKIIALFKQKTGQELPATFFSSHPTVEDVQADLDSEMMTTKTTKPTTAEPKHQLPSNDSTSKEKKSSASTSASPTPDVESRAVLVQGKSSSTQRPMFMVTDGYGSADAFIHLPPLAKGQRLYALESPFLDCPEKFTLSIPQLAKIFIQAIRKIQPEGPYLIGGRSAGACFAYEVAYQLTEENEKIDGLVLMDMRAPRAVSHAKTLTMSFMESSFAVIIANSKNFLNPNLKEHVLNSVRALYSYDPVPFSKQNRPAKIHIIWAALGVNDGPSDELRDSTVTRPAEMGPPFSGVDDASISMDEFESDFKSWFWGRRHDFGGNGWEALLGDDINCHKVDGDHFCMMTPPYVKEVGSVLASALSDMEQ